MNRREFLKLSTLTVLASLAPSFGMARLLVVPVEAEHQGRRYRGTHDGKILVSTAGSTTWRLHTNLGHQCAIIRLVPASNGRLYSQMSFQGRPFQLVLTDDGNSWRTAG